MVLNQKLFIRELIEKIGKNTLMSFIKIILEYWFLTSQVKIDIEGKN